MIMAVVMRAGVGGGDLSFLGKMTGKSLTMMLMWLLVLGV